MKKSTFGALTLAALMAAAPAMAQTETATVYRGVTGAEIGDLVRQAGYTAEISVTDDDFSPMVTTQMSGFNIYIYTYVCDRQQTGKGPPARCESVQLLLPLSDVIEPELIERWNREYRYAKAWTSDSTGGVRLTYDFLVDGTTADEFLRTLDMFHDLIDEFIDFIQ